jgi:dienelactone hydrolase
VNGARIGAAPYTTAHTRASPMRVTTRATDRSKGLAEGGRRGHSAGLMRRLAKTTATSGILLSICLAASLMPATAAAAGGAFAVAGPKTVIVKDLSPTAKIAAPDTGGPYPLVVASHGFSASGDNQIGWAKHFASWGLVVVVPTFPNSFSPDTATNAGIIESLVMQLEGPLAAAQGVAPGVYGVEGHSAGGLATAVAALKLAPAATVLFDPVDKNADGKNAYAKLCSPVLAIFAGASSCNNNAEWRGFETSTTSSLLAFDVKGSTHCDGENDARALCGGFCGGAASADRQAVYAHYATAFLLSHLTNDPAATAALADATVDADPAIDGIHHAVATCSAPIADAGTTDASTDGSAPRPGGPGEPPADAAPPSTTPPADGASPSSGPAAASGCGCRTTRAASSPLTLAVLALPFAAFLARSRSRSRSRSR